MLVGSKVRVEKSPWTEANEKTGIIKGSINTQNMGTIFLVRFDDNKINRLSSDVGGFTFEPSHLYSL